jgi:dolichol-phosphate mannosyltransferase
MTAGDPVTGGRPLLSVVTPVFNEADNLAPIYTRLADALAALDLEWEWIAVDDHSDDGSFEVLSRLAKEDGRLRVVRLTRNFGSHAAIACGLDAARGDAAVVMSADLQDSPESIAPLVEHWHAGAQVVWGVRAGGPAADERRSILSRLYERLVRRIVGVDALPPSNADFVLLDRAVVDAVRESGENRAPVFMLVAWLGFRQESVECTKTPRAHGESGWTVVKKIELVTDSIIAFTERPLRWISALGLVTAAAGLLYALVVIANAVVGNPVAGWSSLMVVVLVIGGGQMLMLGVIGAYVWRALDETRRRPRYVIEATTATTESTRPRG